MIGTGPRLQMLSDDDAVNRFIEKEFARWAKAIGLAHKLRTMRIAQCIASSFRRNGVSCRGINRRNFAVLREHNSPGILIETGYLTNSAEAARLNDSAYRSKLAAAIAEGIADHFSR